MVVLAGTCDRAALLTDYVIAEKVSGNNSLILRFLLHICVHAGPLEPNGAGVALCPLQK
jgi:hypothetical protein